MENHVLFGLFAGTAAEFADMLNNMGLKYNGKSFNGPTVSRLVRNSKPNLLEGDELEKFKTLVLNASEEDSPELINYKLAVNTAMGIFGSPLVNQDLSELEDFNLDDDSSEDENFNLDDDSSEDEDFNLDDDSSDDDFDLDDEPDTQDFDLDDIDIGDEEDLLAVLDEENDPSVTPSVVEPPTPKDGEVPTTTELDTYEATNEELGIDTEEDEFDLSFLDD